MHVCTEARIGLFLWSSVATYKVDLRMIAVGFVRAPSGRISLIEREVISPPSHKN